LLIEIDCHFAHFFIGSLSDLAVSVIPLLATSALDPELAIHLGIL